MTGRRGWALPAAAGLLLALAHPPARLLVPAFVGLVPLLVFIEDQPAGAAGRWAATRAGLMAGGLYFGLQLYWLVVALLRYSLLAIPAYLATVAILAGLTGAFARGLHFTGERTELPLALRVAVLWTFLEWVQGHAGDLSVPWLGLGAGLAPYPALAGAADLVGARGLTVWVAGVNGLLAQLVLRARAGRRALPLLAFVAVAVALPAAYGVGRAATLTLRPAARVALVQPNIPEDVKLDPRLALDSSLAALIRLTGELAGERVDLVVWPEIALPAELDQGLRRRVEALAADVGAPILVGAWGTDGNGGTFNSAFLVGPGTGPSAPRYDKQRLVPFVERVPFVDPELLPLPGKSRFGRLERGRERPVLGLESGARFGTLICFESIFSGLARSDRRRGADFLVNLTNDAWFGVDAWWGRTTGLRQHPAHVVLRAIETRTGVARAANTGVSQLVDPVGRAYAETDLFVPAVRVATVYTTDSTTFFVRWGDWLGTLAAATALALLLAAAVGSRRTRTPTRRS